MFSLFYLERKKMKESILEIFFPTVCGICGKIEPSGICPKCNLEIQKDKKVTIYNYSSTSFSRHLTVFQYQGKIRQLLLDYKFADKAYLCESFVNLLLKDKKICGFLESYDIIIAVPISKKRKKQRGYNQSLLIAKKLSQKIDTLKLEKEVLIKKIDNIPQSSLDKIARRKNVIGTYEVKQKQKIQNKKIILLDDIFTTGSTVQECASILKEAGAKEVAVLTLAKD